MNLDIQEQNNDVTFSHDDIKYAEREVFQYVQDGDIAGLNEYLITQFMMALRRA